MSLITGDLVIEGECREGGGNCHEHTASAMGSLPALCITSPCNSFLASVGERETSVHAAAAAAASG